MEIGRHRIVRRDREPFLEVEIDGRTALIYHEQKGWQDGIIFLGPEFNDSYSVVQPADPADGRPTERIIEGATDDPQIVALFTEFRRQLDDSEEIE